MAEHRCKFNCFWCFDVTIAAQARSTRSAQVPSSSNNPESGRPPFDVKSIEDLETILKFIERRLEAADGPQSQPNPNSSEVSESGPQAKQKSWLPQIVKSSLNDAAIAISKVGKVFEDPSDPKGSIYSVAAESLKVLEATLGGLGNLHWAGAGLLVVASILNRFDQMTENKETCVKILKNLSDLGGQLVRLYPLFEEKNKIGQAATCLLEGAVLCEEYGKSGRLKRFFLGPIHRDQLDAFQGRIAHLYRDLALAASTANLLASNDIRARIPRTLDSTYRPQSRGCAVGVEGNLSKVLEALGVSERMESAVGVQVLLVHGMGGIGKTTLAKAICAKPRFPKHSFAEVTFGESVTLNDISECQNIIYERLSGKVLKIGSSDEGSQSLAKCFHACENPVLLFIDNVFKAKDLDNLLPYPLELPDQSRVVITSRYNRVISEAYCMRDLKHSEYGVPELNPSQARELLEHHLGESPVGKEKEINLILEWCNGLPLAIEIVGAYLKSNKEEGWRAVVDCLETRKEGVGHGESVTGLVADRRLDQIFKLSYETLEKRVKEVFLDITCLMRDANMLWVKRTNLDLLEKLSLVKKNFERSRGDAFAQFWNGETRFIHEISFVLVHDLCVSFGRHSSGEERLTSTGEHFLPSPLHGDDEAACRNVEGLLIENCDEALPVRKLDMMANSLRILIVKHGVRISGGICQRSAPLLEVCSVRKGCPYKDLQGLHNLRVLDLGWDAQCDFEHAKLPGKLEFLRILGVRSLTCFHPDAFRDCKSLQTVDIRHCKALKALPDSFCELESLSVFVLWACDKVEILPRDFHRLQNLQSILLGESIQMLPSKIGKLVKLQDLFIRGCKIHLSDSFADLSRLQYLFLDVAQKQRFPLGLGNLSSLKVLHLNRFATLQAEDFSQLTSVYTLRMTIPGDMAEIPTMFAGLLSLQELVLRGCESLRRVPEDVSQLTALKSLEIHGCNSLEELPDELGKLRALEGLSLEGCTNLQRLPEDISQLMSLKALTLRGCKSLTELPQGFGNLLALETLKLFDCERLVLLPNDLPQLSSLETMFLSSCRSLEGLPEGFGNLPQLVSLELKGNKALQALPEGFFRLKSLRWMSLVGCKALTTLPPVQCDEGSSPLHVLILSGCEGLVQLPNDFSKLRSLEGLRLKYCRSLKELPEGFGNLSYIHTLNLEGCGALQRLPDDLFQKLKNLRDLNVSGCKLLQRLPPVFDSGLPLHKLDLTRCERLAQLTDDLSRLKKLRELRMQGSEGGTCSTSGELVGIAVA